MITKMYFNCQCLLAISIFPLSILASSDSYFNAYQFNDQTQFELPRKNHPHRRLGRFIKHYDPLSYDTQEVHQTHTRVRRSARTSGATDKTVEIKFSGKGRHFHLKLAPDDNLFTNDFEQLVSHESENQKITFKPSSDHEFHPTSHIYYGHLHGEPETSKVYGSIINGVFQHGVIKTVNGTYYVDHIKNHLDGKMTSPSFHSVIYHENDVDFPWEGQKHATTCGGDRLSAPEEWLQYPPADQLDIEEPEHEILENEEDSPVADSSSSDDTPKSRQKRQIWRNNWNTRKVDFEKTTCVLGIEVDYYYYQYYNDREEVLGNIASHVRAISDIYRTTEFFLPNSKENEAYRGIHFQVKRVKINDRPNSNPRFRKKNIGVEKFLELASEDNFDLFCLHYVFTKRDFDNGVLGLAWVAQPRASVGGICEKHRTIPGSGQKSMNTGIITIENYGSTVPSRVSHITFAHEVGHNFGSPHDSGSECTPGEGTSFKAKNEGNFIMFSRATSGLKDNNKLFSECSKRNISAVLEVKSSCFIQSDAPICGNGIVDKPNEECDCGFEPDCQARNDNCCVPAGSNIPGEEECTLFKRSRNGRPVQCSPSQGPCCDGSCQFRGPEYECAPDTDCRYAQTCPGNDYQCTPGFSKPNRTTTGFGRF